MDAYVLEYIIFNIILEFCGNALQKHSAEDNNAYNHKS